MAKALVVVESPAKAKTINKYLGRDIKVVAPMGHIRDLPKSKLGVDIENDFAEEYESIASRRKDRGRFSPTSSPPRGRWLRSSPRSGSGTDRRRSSRASCSRPRAFR